MEYIRQKVIIVPLESVEIEDKDLYNQIESKVDFELFINRLPAGYKKIAQMLSEGYKKGEIVKELKVSHHTIKKVLNMLKDENRQTLNRQ